MMMVLRIYSYLLLDYRWYMQQGVETESTVRKIQPQLDTNIKAYAADEVSWLTLDEKEIKLILWEFF